MKTFFLLLSFFLVALLHFNLSAQNLVPNGSFEDTVACPLDVGQISYCLGWNSYLLSPDYFNPCTNSLDAGMPNNMSGSQYPATGNSYSGLTTFFSSSTPLPVTLPSVVRSPDRQLGFGG